MNTNRKKGIDFKVELPPGLPDDLVQIYEAWPERFRSKVLIGPNCWLWTACVTVDGYGRYNAGRRGEGVLRAHRASLLLADIEIPDGYVVDHLCRNPSCVRPDHLDPVTQSLNVRRGTQGNGSGWCRAGLHKWVAENIAPQGAFQRCRACHAANEKARYTAVYDQDQGDPQ